MAKDALIQARIERSLKKEVDQILNELGISASEVINALYSQIKLRRGIPFDVRVPLDKSRGDKVSEVFFLNHIKGFGDLICIAFEDETCIKAPVSKFPELAAASKRQRENWQLEGEAIFWPNINAKISVQTFIDARLVPNEETRAALERTKKGEGLSEAMNIEDFFEKIEAETGAKIRP